MVSKSTGTYPDSIKAIGLESLNKPDDINIDWENKSLIMRKRTIEGVVHAKR